MRPFSLTTLATLATPAPPHIAQQMADGSSGEVEEFDPSSQQLDERFEQLAQDFNPLDDEGNRVVTQLRQTDPTPRPLVAWWNDIAETELTAKGDLCFLGNDLIASAFRLCVVKGVPDLRRPAEKYLFIFFCRHFIVL